MINVIIIAICAIICLFEAIEYGFIFWALKRLKSRYYGDAVKWFITFSQVFIGFAYAIIIVLIVCLAIGLTA